MEAVLNLGPYDGLPVKLAGIPRSITLTAGRYSRFGRWTRVFAVYHRVADGRYLFEPELSGVTVDDDVTIAPVAEAHPTVVFA